MDRGIGLRERKKEATRLALHEAAFRLTYANGLDNVTIEAIADAAAVSRRTFSNYFPSKEAALLYQDSLRLRRLVTLVHDRPAEEPAWTALLGATEEFIAEHDSQNPQWLAQIRLLRGHPTLIYQQVVTYVVSERELTAELARRLPPGPTTPFHAKVLAATFLTALRVAIRTSLDQEDESIADLLRQALTIIQDRLG